MTARRTALLVTFGLVAGVAAVVWMTSESSEDKAAKPDAANNVLSQSLTDCELGPKNGSYEEYSKRQLPVLMDLRTKALRFFKENNYTVCGDQRLAHQERGWGDAKLYGVYYPDGSNGGIITVVDEGKTKAELGWFGDNTPYAAELLGKIANRLQDGEKDKVLYGYTYEVETCTTDSKTGVRSCNSTTYADWKEKFDRDTLRQNPWWKNPPLRDKTKDNGMAP